MTALVNLGSESGLERRKIAQRLDDAPGSRSPACLLISVTVPPCLRRTSWFPIPRPFNPQHAIPPTYRAIRNRRYNVRL